MTVDIPKDIGRNDPCPCGSGKKYKKCHQKAHQLQKETEKSTVAVTDLVGSETTPWKFFKTLQNVRDNNLLNLAHEFIHPSGPLFEKHNTVDAWVKAVANGEADVFCRDGFEMIRLRHDGESLFMMLARGLNDPKFPKVAFEILELRDNQSGGRDEEPIGFRIWNVVHSEHAKEGLSEMPRFEEIGINWSWA